MTTMMNDNPHNEEIINLDSGSEDEEQAEDKSEENEENDSDKDSLDNDDDEESDDDEEDKEEDSADKNQYKHLKRTLDYRTATNRAAR